MGSGDKSLYHGRVPSRLTFPPRHSYAAVSVAWCLGLGSRSLELQFEGLRRLGLEVEPTSYKAYGSRSETDLQGFGCCALIIQPFGLVSVYYQAPQKTDSDLLARSP